MRELLALLLIILLVAISALNVLAADKLCSNIEAQLLQAEANALKSRWPEAEAAFTLALETWLNAESYSHVFIRHPEIDSCTELFYDLHEAILSQSGPEIKALFEKLLYRIGGIAQMEKLRLGNVF